MAPTEGVGLGRGMRSHCIGAKEDGAYSVFISVYSLQASFLWKNELASSSFISGQSIASSLAGLFIMKHYVNYVF